MNGFLGRLVERASGTTVAWERGRDSAGMFNPAADIENQNVQSGESAPDGQADRTAVSERTSGPRMSPLRRAHEARPAIPDARVQAQHPQVTPASTPAADGDRDDIFTEPPKEVLAQRPRRDTQEVPIGEIPVVPVTAGPRLISAPSGEAGLDVGAVVGRDRAEGLAAPKRAPGPAGMATVRPRFAATSIGSDHWLPAPPATRPRPEPPAGALPVEPASQKEEVSVHIGTVEIKAVQPMQPTRPAPAPHPSGFDSYRLMRSYFTRGG